MSKPLGDFPIRPEDFPYKIFRWFGRIADTVRKQEVYRKTFTPVAFSTTTSEQDFTIKGLSLNDSVSVSKPDYQLGVSIGNCRVSAINTLSITFVNQTGGSVIPTSGIYLINSVRF